MRLSSGAALAVAALAAVDTACSSDKAAKLAPVVDATSLVSVWAPLRFGDGIDDAHVVMPDLAATGWQSGTRSSYLGHHDGMAIEIETDGPRIVAVSFDFVDAAAEAAARVLHERLPGATDCSPLPTAIQDFRPQLWRLASGGGVTAIRKGTHLHVQVSEPADAELAAQLAACAHQGVTQP